MRLGRAVCLGTIALLASCAAIHREQAPATTFDTTTPVGFRSVVRYANGYANEDSRAIRSRFLEVLQRRRAASPDGTVNILALSGGGAGGAFGAGALIGLSQSGERPQFDIVTGVSTGALIAPFAFLGPAWDTQLADAFSGAHTEHLLDSRGVGVLFGPGIHGSEPLVDLVDQFVTDGLIRAVAREAALGRLLLVATTNLDTEETVIWDMGQIAAHGGEPARTLFRDVLVASASIPGVFSPIVIPVEKAGVRYDEMHVDGDATMPFFVAPALTYLRPTEADGLKGANIYVLVNGQLGDVPHTTPVDTVSIISRSVAATLTHLARMNIVLTSEFARKYDLNFRFSAIPMDYPSRGPLDFQRSSMRALLTYASDCAREGRLWTTVEQAMGRGQRAASIGLASDAQPTPSCPLDVPPMPYQNTAQLR
jgi:predicted acylesterase/phospholipase RssA